MTARSDAPAVGLVELERFADRGRRRLDQAEEQIRTLQHSVAALHHELYELRGLIAEVAQRWPEPAWHDDNGDRA